MKMTRRMGRFFCRLAGGITVAALSGCGHYQLGTTLPNALRDVYVPSVRNDSGQPGVENEVTRALLEEIRREGTLRIVPEHRATTRLDVAVVNYQQDAIRYRREHSDVAEEYRMVLRAQVRFSRLADDGEAVVFERMLEGEETFLRGMDAITAMQRCLPKAAKDLSERIVDACVSVW